jgi:Arc/MetJ-type ribon-helix-helix transcriptional regulator
MPAKPLQLHDDVIDLVRAKVDGERFKSESDVVRESLIALQQRDESFDAWLRDVVVPIAEEMKARPERAVSLEDVQASLDRHHQRRSKSL